MIPFNKIVKEFNLKHKVELLIIWRIFNLIVKDTLLY